jgi:hypothetical protein
VLALAVAGLLLAATQGGPGYFLQLGRTSDSLDLAREVIDEQVPVPLVVGHDGERFWVLARDPLLTDGEDLAARLDRPAYRAQRIGYPLLASPWHLAGEDALLWGLFATNLAAVAIGVVATGLIALRRGASAQAGYWFVANPVVWVALLFDLGDAVALAALLAAIYAADRHRPGATAGFGIVAALARETSLLGLGAAAVLTKGLPLKARLALVLPGVITAGVWRSYVMTRPGFDGPVSSRELTLVPLAGYIETWSHGFPEVIDWAYLVITLGMLAFASWTVALWWRDRGDLLLTTALPFAVLMPFLAPVVVDVPLNSIRVLGPAFTLVAIYRTSRRSRIVGDGSARVTTGSP